MSGRKGWLGRRFISNLTIVPGFLLAFFVSSYVWALTPWLPWHSINPYTVGAVTSAAFNTIMVDRWIRLIERYGGRDSALFEATG